MTSGRMPERAAVELRVRGTVQGVGFRPFIYRLAREHNLAGFVRNDGGTVLIQAEGAPGAITAFTAAIRAKAPVLARVVAIDRVDLPPERRTGFRVETSGSDGEAQPVPPDTATCDACLRELFDPGDRRYRYPFINCTDCGPRFTIIEGLPYDRVRTSMRSFPLCAACRREYEDPADRRFHAEPVACRVCGPRVWLEVQGGERVEGDPIGRAAGLLASGAILALKGLGGFHLVCDARSEAAVARLRERKHRYSKPLAVMVAVLEDARALVDLEDPEVPVLAGRERPIVLAKRRADTGLAPSVAPHVATLGIMLPYTPLHHLLLRAFGGPLVMTSGNRSEEPIATANDEARERLDGIADAFLLHDREILARYDDSVVRLVAGEVRPIRRSRGYAPVPVPVPFKFGGQIMAVGAHQKAAACLLKGTTALPGPHVGDLDNVETLDSLRASVSGLCDLFGARPTVIAHDRHPDYASSGLARELANALRADLTPVQHHHAHIASCMVDNGLMGPVIGVAFDGTGLGEDDTIWGGEILVATYEDFTRVGHLRTAPLLGGEAAVRRPYRMAASYIWRWFGDDPAFEPFFAGIPAAERRLLRMAFDDRLHAPDTSSAGRLFDAFSALIGLAYESAYEGEAAVRLEAVASASAEGYPFDVTKTAGQWVMDLAPAYRQAWLEKIRGTPLDVIAGSIHRSLAGAVVRACTHVMQDRGIRDVCLSGGCFQNRLFSELVVDGIQGAGLTPYLSRTVPCNDGGLALGQAAIAAARTSSDRA